MKRMNPISTVFLFGTIICALMCFVTWTLPDAPAQKADAPPKPEPVDPPHYRIAKYSNGRYVIQYYEKTRPDGYYDIGRPETSAITSEKYARMICSKMASEYPGPTVISVLPTSTAKEEL